MALAALDQPWLAIDPARLASEPALTITELARVTSDIAWVTAEPQRVLSEPAPDRAELARVSDWLIGLSEPSASSGSLTDTIK